MCGRLWVKNACHVSHSQKAAATIGCCVTENLHCVACSGNIFLMHFCGLILYVCVCLFVCKCHSEACARTHTSYFVSADMSDGCYCGTRCTNTRWAAFKEAAPGPDVFWITEGSALWFFGLRRGYGCVRLRPLCLLERGKSLDRLHWSASCWGYLFALFYDGNTEQHVFDLFLKMWQKNNWTQIDFEGFPSYVINITQGWSYT